MALVSPYPLKTTGEYLVRALHYLIRSHNYLLLFGALTNVTFILSSYSRLEVHSHSHFFCWLYT